MLSAATVWGLPEKHNYMDAFRQLAEMAFYMETLGALHAYQFNSKFPKLFKDSSMLNILLPCKTTSNTVQLRRPPVVLADCSTNHRAVVG